MAFSVLFQMRAGSRLTLLFYCTHTLCARNINASCMATNSHNTHLWHFYHHRRVDDHGDGACVSTTRTTWIWISHHVYDVIHVRLAHEFTRRKCDEIVFFYIQRVIDKLIFAWIVRVPSPRLKDFNETNWLPGFESSSYKSSFVSWSKSDPSVLHCPLISNRSKSISISTKRKKYLRKFSIKKYTAVDWYESAFFSSYFRIWKEPHRLIPESSPASLFASQLCTPRAHIKPFAARISYSPD